MTKSEFGTPGQIEVVLKTLQQSEEPLTAEKLRDRLPPGPYRISKEQLSGLLEDQVALGHVHRFKFYISKSSRYWTRDVEFYARECTLRAIHEGRPYTQSEVWAKLKTMLKDYTVDRYKQLLRHMVREKQVCEWPPFLGGRTKLLSARPPEAQAYIQDALAKIGKKLGIVPEQLIETVAELRKRERRAVEAAAPSMDDLCRTILDRMVQIKPAAASGAPVSLRELRKAVGIERAGFDAAVFHLAEQGRVAIHHHDYPSSLTEGERNEMVTDGRGNYYSAISLRY